MKTKISPVFTVFIILSLFLLINNSHGKSIFSFSASETGSSIVVETPDYNVKIQKSPYSLSVLNGNKEILKNKAGSGDIGGSFFIRGNNKYHLLRILKWEIYRLIMNHPMNSLPANVCILDDHAMDPMSDQSGAKVPKTRKEWKANTRFGLTQHRILPPSHKSLPRKAHNLGPKQHP